MNVDIAAVSNLINQSLSAAIAIIAGSLFLYVLSKNLRNSLSWAVGALLLFVTVTYIGDLGVAYNTDPVDAEPWLRFQWAGIAFVPAAYVHLSHNLLELTGSTSRGRRRIAAAILYLLAFMFFILGLSSDVLVGDVRPLPAPHLAAGPIFWLFVVYFVASIVVSAGFVLRARRRTLTGPMRRRFSLLLAAYGTPALAVFPYLIIASPEALERAWVFAGILTVVNTTLAVMLVAMFYPLVFFISLLPDRLVKAQMMQFLMRGPLVAIAALAVITWIPRMANFLSIGGEVIMPFLAVGVILLLQWSITIIRPFLERWLIYAGDEAEVRKIQDLEQRLLTGTDFHQLLESILASLCEYLRVRTAFVATLEDAVPNLESAIGLDSSRFEYLVKDEGLATFTNGGTNDLVNYDGKFLWKSFWLVPLRSGDNGGSTLTGILGVAAPDGEKLDAEQMNILDSLAARVAEVLEDRRLQTEVFASLEGLLPEIAASQRLRAEARYASAQDLTRDAASAEVLEDPQFAQFVKDALSHYWGGPKLSRSRLMSLAVVREALDEHQGNPQQALRAVLLQAIEDLKPGGQRSMTTGEWILYNILEMRFVQGRKVRDVALRLAMSESDLYRKQRVAIEAAATRIAEMERLSKSDEPGIGENPGGTFQIEVPRSTY